MRTPEWSIGEVALLDVVFSRVARERTLSIEQPSAIEPVRNQKEAVRYGKLD